MASDILVIDDEADIRDLVSGILEDHGHQVRAARDSDEALDALRRRSPVRPADSSLWPYSSPRGGRALPVTLPCGARTFLCLRYGQLASPAFFRTQRLPSQLHCGFYHARTGIPAIRLQQGCRARTAASSRYR